ncbi:uncharacterized protein FOMMEDRAFT_165358 [Fomitiporia mediterranea MF3/22]|uniref:uncharacterized protein n=1 Tax=Fomitiporia mediterranea (strain MF3/22) TaxID=694068 RepID=UPI00044076BE|nr:uncharacterized protein FOMMEDRAFT_165358 [Fomitiporia mediterranea MF3/22]EJD06606.1 hypothetical protein FOMMEDRAFT_165358 [Fomitiporia mediterranea MF3/22]
MRITQPNGLRPQMSSFRMQQGKEKLIFVPSMSYAAVPLYRTLCTATGFSGTPIVSRSKFFSEQLILSRKREEFGALPVETSLTFYKARNMSSQDVIGIATYNVSPGRIATCFTKFECFCFEEQKLFAGKEVNVLLPSFIGQDVLNDPACKDVGNVVLSYTFFRARRNERGQLDPDAPEDGVRASSGFDKYKHAEENKKDRDHNDRLSTLANVDDETEHPLDISESIEDAESTESE